MAADSTTCRIRWPSICTNTARRRRLPRWILQAGPLSLTVGPTSERVIGTLVSGNYFDVLGTRPVVGRFFRADEDRVPGERPVVVLSHAMWARRFNSDPDILSRPLRLNNLDFTVIGVAEEGFQGSSMIGTDLWVPMAMVQVVRGLGVAKLLIGPAFGLARRGRTAARRRVDHRSAGRAEHARRGVQEGNHSPINDTPSRSPRWDVFQGRCARPSLRLLASCSS